MMLSKLLFVHNYYRIRGGERTVLEAEAAVARANGVQVALLTRDSAEAHVSDLIGTLGGIYNWAGKRSIRDTIAAFRPDLIHVHNAHPLVTDAVYDAAEADSVPLIHTLHNYRFICSSAILYRKAGVCEKCVGRSGLAGIVNRCYRRSATASAAVVLANAARRLRVAAGAWPHVYWLALSSAARDLLIRGGMPADRILVKGNFLPDADPLDLPEKNRDGFIYVGRLSEEKGIADLMGAWDRRGERLTIIGSGPYESIVSQWAQTRPHVRYLGHQPREVVRTEMVRHRVLVFPSKWYEGFPMVLLEGLATGLAVVSTAMGAVAEIAPPGVVGLSFSPGDLEAFRRALDRMDADTAADFGRAARKRFDLLYSRERGWQEMVRVYEQALGSLRVSS